MTTAARKMVRQRTDVLPFSEEPTFGGPTKFNGTVKELVEYYNYNPVQDVQNFGGDFTGRAQFKIGHPDMSSRLDDIDGNWTDKRLEGYKNYIPYDAVSPKYTFGKPSNTHETVDELVHAKWQHEYEGKQAEKQAFLQQLPARKNQVMYSSSHDKSINTKRDFYKENINLTKTPNARNKMKRMALNKNFFLNKIQCAENARTARAGYIGEQAKLDYERAMRFARKDKNPMPHTDRMHSDIPQVTETAEGFQPNPTKMAKRFNLKSFYKRGSEDTKEGRSVDKLQLPSIINTEHKPVSIPKLNQTMES